MAGQIIPRKFARASKRIPLSLLIKSRGYEAEQTALTVDVSKSGLRIRTNPPLSPGQAVYVFSPHQQTALGFCRVVWAQAAGSSRAAEAGLEILNPPLASA